MSTHESSTQYAADAVTVDATDPDTPDDVPVYLPGTPTLSGIAWVERFVDEYLR
ncbi:hypothetical protein [Natronolimnohabitans innermongolicus]|uniref:hypothetical protein n=1 Tax=Natronolimnohabitans innermongolicus TaxID=253107 RepID=UPI000A54EE34|nr:hypothetical protein [Natronolimnohabitans innermongolicus]